ncbi:MAG: PqqD family peptide modification chaperone [Candidatus Solibacter sp.]
MLSKPEHSASAHRVLLTFDDGPHPLHTVSVLDELARRGLRAVFFVLGQHLESPGNRAILERAASDGHLIGNHGYAHQKLTHLTDDQIRIEVRRTEALIGNLDRGIKLWRPPFSDRDSRVDSVMASLGYTRMLWNVDSLDWRDNAPAVPWVDHTLERIRLRRSRGFRNTVCLFHDALPATAAQLGHLLERLSELPGTRIARYNPWHFDGLCLPEEAALPHASLVFPPDAVSFRLGDSRVVARTHVNALYVLNQSASLLWDALAGGASEAQAAQSLARQYSVSEDLVLRDVQSALADWRARGLLGPKPPELEDPGPWPRSMDEVDIAVGGNFEEEHAYRFLDLRFRIRFQTADLAKAIHPRFANLEATETIASERIFEVVSVSGDCAVRLPDGVVTRRQSAAALAYLLFFEIMRLAHPDLDPMACLHSSLVDCGDGAVALVGNNGSGKSTLAAALASSGLRVLSDDQMFLDFATRRPAATPNAVGLKRGSCSPLLSRYPAIFQLPVSRSEGEEIRFLLPPPPIERLLPPVKHVFFPRYSAATATAAIPLTSVQAIERIAAAEGWISSDPEKLGAFLQWTDRLRCYDLPFSNLDAAIERIGECLRA